MGYVKGAQEEEATNWMKKAGDVAERALCTKARCGCVIVQDGTIIGEGYNAPPLDSGEHRMCAVDGGSGKPKYDRTCCMHAEWRAIIHALKEHPEKIKNAKLYFTRVNELGEVIFSGKPYCTVCSRLALDVGISHFVLWHKEGVYEYPTGEYNSLSYAYVHDKNCK